MEDGTDDVADDEFLYRRVPTSTHWYEPATGLKPEAFGPHKENDPTGISVSRAKYTAIKAAARGRQGRTYYVAVLRAGDLRHMGIEVEPRPLPGDPGHAELPALNSANRKDDRTLELQRLLADLCTHTEGPFPTVE